MADQHAPKIPPGVSRVDEIDKRGAALRDNLKKRKEQKVQNKIYSEKAESNNEIPH